jgi:hypothetical protein
LSNFSRNNAADLKRTRLSIFYSWLFLICFIAGQYVVYAHQHKTIAGAGNKAFSISQSTSHQTVKEKCSLCDAMHHTNWIISHPVYFNPNIVTNYFFEKYNYNFISIALILSAGRAPPTSAFC